MHKKGFYHRDIKPDNILYQVSTKSYKLTDFGESCKFTNNILKCHYNKEKGKDDVFFILSFKKLYLSWQMKRSEEISSLNCNTKAKIQNKFMHSEMHSEISLFH